MRYSTVIALALLMLFVVVGCETDPLDRKPLSSAETGQTPTVQPSTPENQITTAQGDTEQEERTPIEVVGEDQWPFIGERLQRSPSETAEPLMAKGKSAQEDQDPDFYANSKILWQAESPTCFPSDRPIEEQMDAVEPFVVGGDTTEPKKIQGPMPSSDTFEGIHFVRGLPVFELVVNKEGSVESVVSLRSLSSEIDSRLGELLRQWRFEPATRAGQPVCVHYIMVVHIDWR